MDYLRFWVVRTLTRANPLVLFAGSPIYVLYLRLLGAKIGKGVVIFSRTVPVCTDLLTIGDNTVIYSSSFFICCRARTGVIEKGTVTLGSNVLVSEQTTFDIGTSMGNNSQLGHASALLTGQTVPDGQNWHGSPAERTGTNFRRVPPAICSTRRRVIFSLLQLFNRLVLVVPALVLGLAAFLPSYLDTGHLELSAFMFFVDVAAVTLLVFISGVVGGLIFVLTVPRLLNLFLETDKVYPLYGVHYSLQRLMSGISNVPLYKTLFGDSSYIVHYLKALGYDLGKVVQTGSNFGPAVAHESPFLSSVGSGTMASDGLTMMNAEFTNTSFRLSPVSVAARNFLGNNIIYPIGARVGENCLLASKVMVPIDGPVRSGVGLLGSPAFEIPRSVQRDARFDDVKLEEARNQFLPAKNRYNIRTMAIYLAVRWFLIYVATLFGGIAVTAHGFIGLLAVAGATLGFMLFSIFFSILVERSVMGFRRLKPEYCSIYDRYFWRHELLWKLLAGAPFGGTPFKPPFMRLLGIRVGRRLYDPGAGIIEKTLVTIGDDCALNEGSLLQGHSLEDGTFKSGPIVIGDRCTVGVNSFVHYGVTIRDGATIEADAFLMKGGDVPEDTVYAGNPAREVRTVKPELRAASGGGGPRHRASSLPGAHHSLPRTTAGRGAHAPRRHAAVRR
jgi:non-ribosomal peptide synthetase-like protein